MEAKEYKYALPQLEMDADETALPKTETLIFDVNWLRIGFQNDIEDYDETDLKFQYRSTVFTELMDTTLGGHFTINPAYSWGPTSDIHYRGRMAEAKIFTPESQELSIGIGRYYSEAINHNSKVRTLILEAGVPEFKNMFSFLIGGIDIVKAEIAMSGRTPFFYNAGKAIGIGMSFVAFPILTATFWLLEYAADTALNLFDPRYYTLKSSMPSFWSKANTILNTLAADRGIISSIERSGSDGKSGTEPSKQGEKASISEYDRKVLAEMMPHLFKLTSEDGSSGMLDLSAISGRFQKLINEQLEKEKKAYETGDLDLYCGIVKPDKKDTGLGDYMKDLEDLPAFKAKDPMEPTAGLPKSTQANIDRESLYLPDKDDGRFKFLPHDLTEWFNSVGKYFEAGVKSGADKVALQVDYVGSSTDTFTNTIKDIPIKSQLNGISKRVRDVRFSVSDGNVFGEAVKSLYQATSDIISGVLDGATFGLTNILHALNGGGLYEIPKMWDDSTAQIATHTFKLHLGGPYGNPISLMMDIDVPLSILLAAMLPQQVGRASYSSPFLLKGFMRSVLNSDLMMMTSLSITRGSGPMPYSVTHAATDLDVTFTLTELSPVVSAPTPNGIAGAFELSLDQYSGFNRYSRMITGQDYSYTVFMKKRALLALSKQYLAINSIFSPEYMGKVLSDSFVGKAAAMFIGEDLSNVDMFVGD